MKNSVVAPTLPLLLVRFFGELINFFIASVKL